MPSKYIDYDKVCLFCGQQMTTKWDEYSPYHECDCPYAIEDRRIDDEIQKLEDSRPAHRFEIVKTVELKKL